MRGGHICLGTNWAPFPFHCGSAFLPCGSCKQPNKQTNKHMGTQTLYYHHIADAAWFGLYFSRCHSNGKPGSKSEYPLWCSTPPYGKTIVTEKKAWSVFLPLLPNSSSAEILQRPVICPSEPQGDHKFLHGGQENTIFAVTSSHSYSLLWLLFLPWWMFRSGSMFTVHGLSSAGF